MRLKRNRQTTGASGRDAAHGDLRQRAAGVCVVVGCTEPSVPGEGRCRGHGPAPWAGSEETGRQLVPPPAVYRRLRRDVRRRARHYCEACGSRVLPLTGQVNHRRPQLQGGLTEMANLWLLCDACADVKTRADLYTIAEEQSERNPLNPPASAASMDGALLTVAVTQRFVGEQVGQEAAAAEVEIERDEAEVLAELRDLQRRLRDLEGRFSGSARS